MPVPQVEDLPEAIGEFTVKGPLLQTLRSVARRRGCTLDHALWLVCDLSWTVDKHESPYYGDQLVYNGTTLVEASREIGRQYARRYWAILFPNLEYPENDVLRRRQVRRLQVSGAARAGESDVQ